VGEGGGEMREGGGDWESGGGGRVGCGKKVERWRRSERG